VTDIWNGRILIHLLHTQKSQLDGTWGCKLDSGVIITVYVQFHSFSLGDRRPHFFINDDKKACFRMTHSLYVSDQEIQPNSNWPGVGKVFRFESEVGFGFIGGVRIH
jgi:hypothetical protein